MARTRITGSQIRNSFTLIQKPCRIASKDSRAWKPLKNVSCTRGQPGELDDADRQHGEDHDGDHGGDQRLPDPLPPAYLAALELARRWATRRSGSLQHGDVHHVGEPLLLELVEGAVRRRASASASLTQVTSALPFSKSIPNCSCSPVSGWNWPTIVLFGISTAVM